MRKILRITLILFITLLLLPINTDKVAAARNKGQGQRAPDISVTWLDVNNKPVNAVTTDDQVGMAIKLNSRKKGKLVLRYRISQTGEWQYPPRTKDRCTKWQRCAIWRGTDLEVAPTKLKAGTYTATVQYRHRRHQVVTIKRQLQVTRPIPSDCKNNLDNLCWQLPVAEHIPITSWFGPRWGTLHDGIDFGAACGTPVSTISSGKVVATGNSGIVLGNQSDVHTPANYVIVQHSPKWKSYYWHLNKVSVRVGDNLLPGQELGKSGNTGYVRGDSNSPLNQQGCHLHLELHKFGIPIDPAILLLIAPN